MKLPARPVWQLKRRYWCWSKFQCHDCVEDGEDSVCVNWQYGIWRQYQYQIPKQFENYSIRALLEIQNRIFDVSIMSKFLTRLSISSLCYWPYSRYKELYDTNNTNTATNVCFCPISPKTARGLESYCQYWAKCWRHLYLRFQKDRVFWSNWYCNNNYHSLEQIFSFCNLAWFESLMLNQWAVIIERDGNTTTSVL